MFQSRSLFGLAENIKTACYFSRKFTIRTFSA